MGTEAIEGTNVSSILSAKPASSAISQVGHIGRMLGRKVVEIAGPGLISQACVSGAIAAVGNTTLGGAIGLGVVAPILSPLMTPMAAYAAGLAVSYGITVAGNLIYNAFTKPEERQVPLPPVESKGIFESIVPGMIGTLMMKGASVAAESSPVGKVMTQMVVPIAAPLFAEAVTKVGGLAVDSISNLAKKILKA
jgi:hypothetical protein